MLAEYDNAGFPLSYCLLSTAKSINIGKRTRALEAWAKTLRDRYRVMPRFVHSDKDMAEISMARTIWPEAKVQLCWWHLWREIRERLAKAKLSTTPYNVLRANREFTFIDVNFRLPGSPDLKEYKGGIPDIGVQLPAKKAPTGPNAIFICLPASQSQSVAATVEERQVPAKKHSYMMSDQPAPGDTSTEEWHTFCPIQDREGIVSLVENHLNTHPLIPGYAAPTPQGIQEWAVKQMYQYCHSHDLREAWAYLWENWYRPGRWELWAQSVVNEIPRLKTTMIMESQ